MIAVHVTCKDISEAKSIAKHLLSKKLVVCANMIPMQSMYLWKKQIQESAEVLLILKTKESNIKAIETEVKKLHSYDVPYIGIFQEKTTAAIEKWLNEEL